MGRWAEVYFTSPPEKREEAVLELLRELEGSTTTNPAREAARERDSAERLEGTQRAIADNMVAAHHDPKPAAPARESETSSIDSIVCQSCGKVNPAQHKFCGMCGADLHRIRSHDSPMVDPEEDEVSGWPIEERESDMGTPAFAGFARANQDPFHGSWASDEGPQLLPYSEPAPYRYRIYIGAAMAILVGALVYMAWRGTSAGVSSHPLPPAPPAASNEAPTPAQTNPAPKSTAPEPGITPAHNANPNETVSSSAAAAPTTTDNKNSAANPSSNRAEPAKAAAAAVPTSEPARGNGSEELTIAENYLNGTQGKAQDSAEAAKWLWRSVSKQNAGAEVLLSDLYMHGNGVAKSCDQARLLLDAAARKGAAGATERLRNLPAFGCQ